MSEIGNSDDNLDEDQIMAKYHLNADGTPMPQLPSPAPRAPDWGRFGKAIQQAVSDFRGDTPSSAGGLPFGNEMGLPTPRAQAVSNQAAPVELNPLNVTSPMQRPGDQAIQALARLYPGFSL